MPIASRFGGNSLRAFGQRGAIPIPSDIYFKNTVLLLHGDGTNNAQNNTFLDNSGNGYTITRSGNTTQGSFSPYGSNWSVFFDGTDDEVLAPNTPANFAGNDFTAECWVLFTTNTAGYQMVMGNQGTGDAQGWIIYTETNNQLTFAYSTGSGWAGSISTGVTPTVGVWTHLAVVRNGTNITFYVNGTASGTPITTSSAIQSPSGNFRIGRYPYFPGGARTINAYISNVRLVNGTAVYTSNFTPTSTPLTAITNTSLLACHANRFLDTSSNNHSITRSGNPRVTKFGPFSTMYTVAGNGGSGFFDGSGDYLSLPANDICSFGSGDFTVEFWMYPTAFYNYIIPFATQSSNADGFFTVAGDSNGGFSAGYYIGGSRPGTSQLTAQLYAWNHVVAQRASGVTSFYLNGVKAGTDYTTTYSLSGADPRIGINPASGSERFTGWMSGVRVTKGSALYSGSTITVPTSPITSSGSNRLLLNFTNAGIYDSTAINNFETVGDAKVSTSQKKFGTGSIYFDGTGDWLEHANKSEWAWLHNGLQDWTIEWWMYHTSTTTQYGIMCTNINSIGSAYGMLMGVNFDPGSGNSATGVVAGHFTRGVDGNRMDWTTGNVLGANQWNHVAVMFNRTTKNVSVYVNGVAAATTNKNMEGNSWTGGDGSAFSYATNDPSFNLNIGRAIGGASGSVWHYNGYIDDLRVTRGVRRYTSNFTVPSRAFPDK